MIGANAVVYVNAFAAPPLSFTARLGIERDLIDPESIACLGHFGGAIERFSVKARELTRGPVVTRPCAPTTDLWFDDGVVAPGLGVRTADYGAADGGEIAGRHDTGEVVRQRAQEHVKERISTSE